MYLNKSEIKELCKELLDDFDRVLSWKWDSGFNALVAELSTARQDEVRTVLERVTSASSGTAARFATRRKISKQKTGDLGDLRDNQVLFTSDPEGNILIFAAWWPWGNGEVISVRIASPSNAEPSADTQGVFAMIKRFFG